MSSQLEVVRTDHVVQISFEKPPQNFVGVELLTELANELEHLDEDVECRVVVLTSKGKNFCAGADFGDGKNGLNAVGPTEFYSQAMRLFKTKKPIVAAVQGAAIGAGVGLALVADFRVASLDSRFSVNFNRLGFHPGFGLTYTLPRLIGAQMASLLFYTGRRITGDEAFRIGLVDKLADSSELLDSAHLIATEIAASAPLAVQSTRKTLRQGFADAVQKINDIELAQQSIHFSSVDFREGVKAMRERRMPAFLGR